MKPNWGKGGAIALAWVSFLGSLVLAVMGIFGRVFLTSGSSLNFAIPLFLVAIVSGILSVALQIIIHSPDMKQGIFVVALMGIVISLIAGIPVEMLNILVNSTPIG